MDKFDEKAVRMKKFICECNDGTDCPRCSAIAAALREAAAEAYEDAGSSDHQYDQVHADWCFAKAASLRAKGE